MPHRGTHPRHRGLFVLDAGFVAAENLKKLSGAQIWTRFTGRDLIDEVHWRAVRERDGTAMESKKFGQWSIQSDGLCLDLPDPDAGCVEVALSGARVVMTPTGLGLPFDGIFPAISDSQ